MNKTTRENLNNLLAPYNAEISTELACLQSKADGNVGDIFKYSKKPVYDFQIVCKKTGLSFANIYSKIYKKIPKHILNEVWNSYFETDKRIYL